MDMPLLSNPVSEYNKREAGACFTIHSASAPSYKLMRRGGCRRAMPADRDHTEHLIERDTLSSGTNGKDLTPCGNRIQTANQSGIITISGDKQTSDDKVSDQISQNGSESKAPRLRGRTQWRGYVLSSRSKSLDWRGGASSPAQDSRTGALTLISGIQAGLGSNRSGSLERGGPKDKGRAMLTESRVMATANSLNSEGTTNGHGEKSLVGRNSKPRLRHSGNAVEKSEWGQSLPTRLRPQSFSGSGIRDTATILGPGGGQSIWERIEKLYGSKEPGKTEGSTRMKRLSAPVGDWRLYYGEGSATTGRGEILSPNSSFSIANPTTYLWRRSYEGESGGTFPRRFSRGETNSLNLQQNIKTSSPSPDRKSSLNPEDSIPSDSPGPDYTGTRGSAMQWQSKLLERSSIQWDRGTLQMGTRSLDRARAKFTVAAEIQAAREAGIMPSAIRQPQPPLEEESAAPSPDQPRHTDGRAGRSKEENGTADGVEGRGGAETTGGTSHGLRNVELKMRSTEPEKENERQESDSRMLGEKKTDREGNGAVESSSLAEDVFDSGAPKIALGATERKAAPRKLIIPSVASVRNKIHQFETLSQRARGSAAGQFPKPTRTFSVPAKPSGVSEGLKKSASEKALGRLRGKWEGVKEGTGSEDKRREEEGNTSEGISGRCREESLDGIQSEKQEEYQVAQRSLNQRSEFMDEVGKGLNSGGVDIVESESRDVAGSKSNCVDVFGKYSRQKNKLEIPLNREARTTFYMDETDFCKETDPERPSNRDVTSILTSNLSLNNVDPSSSNPELLGDQNQSHFDMSSHVIDKDKSPTNIPCDWPFLSHHPLSDNSTTTTTDEPEEESTRASECYEQTHSTPEPGPYRSLVDLAPPVVTDPHRMGKKRDMDLKAWVASVNQKIEGWSDDDDDDDDDGTEKDEDSNYDSDSAESSVTITSNMSQSDRRSFSLSLADLCNFGGVDYESGSESEVRLPGHRSASLSSDASAFSCVSVLPTEELDRLLDDVRSLDDSSLQNYNDVQVVVLHKDMGVGLGFSMAGGADQNKPITVHKVFPLGAAAQEGSIRAGDQVLSINGTTLCGSGHWEATRTLRKAKSRGMGVVVLRRRGVLAFSEEGDGMDEMDSAQTQSRDTGQRVCVQLEKQSRDLGFSLEGGVGSSLGDKPLSIQKVFQGGPASQVLPGDEVVEIQGVSTTGMRRLEAWNLIRRLPPGPVDVILHRPL
ncbi:Pro-interleukin-16 [Merluccius polli]|uniref:Pro-interleukin-16 n=1 Tax=Merluccius polli TaxID=89951 RepID=A0AA47MWH3_MERPO|nr:Pro-interleukin-16 [Merluccius polli]